MRRPLSPIGHRASSGFRFVEPPEGAGEGNPEGVGGGGPEEAGKGGDKTLTQAEVTRIATREKAAGKAAAERELADQLGVPLDEAKAIIKQSKEAADAKKSEADKDREAAAEQKKEAEREREAAKVEIHETRLERAFGREGIDLDDADEKTKRLLRMVTVEPGASFEDVLADVKQLKADFPGLFAGSGEEGDKKDKKRKAPSGDPKGTPPKPSKGEDKFARGAERAKARYSAPAFDPLAKK